MSRRMKMKGSWGIITLVIALFIVTGCTQRANTQTNEPIVIGELAALTGIGTQFGTDEARGVELAIEDVNARGGVNGHQLERILEDTQTDNVATLNAYHKLVDVDNVRIIVGPTWGPYAQLVLPSIENDSVVLVAPAVGEEYQEYHNPNFFKMWPADKEETKPLLTHMQEHSVERLVTVTAIDSWAQTMHDGFVEMNNAIGVPIIAQIEVQPDQKDFRTEALKVKETNADAVYMVFTDFGSAAQFVKQLRFIGFTGTVYAWSGVDNNADFLEVCLNSCGEVLIPIPMKTSRDETFDAKFTARFGEAPATPAAARAYDAVQMLAIAMKNGTDAETIKREMHAIQDYDGASAIKSFRPDVGWPVVDQTFKLRTITNATYADAQ